MVQIKPLDPAFPIQQQLVREAAPVILFNLFTMEPSDERAFLEAWANDAVYMKGRPGFISTQLHRAVGDSPTYINSAVWESTDVFRAAFSDPGFRARLAGYPSSATASPHLFQRIAVPGVCVA